MSELVCSLLPRELIFGIWVPFLVWICNNKGFLVSPTGTSVIGENWLEILDFDSLLTTQVVNRIG